MKIQVIVKSVYGRDMIYPVCTQGVLFCKLLGTKTLTLKDIRVIQAMGYDIETIVRKVDLMTENGT